MQQITIVGNIGQEPQTKTLASGRELMTFSVAVNTRENNPIWYGIVMTKQDGVLQYLTKGRMVAVAGELSPATFKGNLDLTIYGDKLTLCGGKDNQPQPTPTPPQEEHNPQTPPTDQPITY